MKGGISGGVETDMLCPIEPPCHTAFDIEERISATDQQLFYHVR
jgi:hypothetical protein